MKRTIVVFIAAIILAGTAIAASGQTDRISESWNSRHRKQRSVKAAKTATSKSRRKPPRSANKGLEIENAMISSVKSRKNSKANPAVTSRRRRHR